MKYSLSSGAVIVMLFASCSGRGNEQHTASGEEKNEKGQPQGAHLVLTQKQLKRLGIRTISLQRYSTAARSYRIPSSSVVRVLDSAEVYLMYQPSGRIVPVPVRLRGPSGKSVRVQLPGSSSLRGAQLLVAGAGMARLAWLNRQQPTGGHDH